MKKTEKIILSILAVMAVLILADTVYGHTHKREVVERALNFEIPSNCEFVDYFYFLKIVKATIVFPSEKEYDAIFERNLGYDSMLDEKIVNEMDLEFLDGKNVIAALKFYTNVKPEYGVCGVLLKAENCSALCIAKPGFGSYAIDNEWVALGYFS